MTLAAALPKPSGGTAPLARARAELATLTMWTALDAGILAVTELSSHRIAGKELAMSPVRVVSPAEAAHRPEKKTGYRRVST
jgi:hypothetical protein